MDMFGPLQIRLNRRTLQEAQVVIFTCTTTRAIHLELETDKSSEAFLMAFRRFWDIPEIQSAISEEFACDFE